VRILTLHPQDVLNGRLVFISRHELLQHLVCLLHIVWNQLGLSETKWQLNAQQLP